MPDVTSRDLAEATGITLSALIDSSADAILLVDVGGRIVFANRQTEAFFQYSREELIGRNIDLLVPERYQADHPSRRQEFVANPEARPLGVGLSLSARRRDGTELPVEISLNPIHTDKGLWIHTAVRDISPRRKAEDALEQARDQLDHQQVLRMLMKNLPGMVFRCRADEDWTMEFASPAGTTLTGVPVSEFLNGQRSFFREVVHEDDREQLLKEIQVAEELGRPFDLEYRIRTASGAVRWVWQRGLVTRPEADGDAVLEGFLSDVSARREAERSLQRTERRFEALARLSPVGIFRADPDGDVVYVNERWCRLSGLTASQAMGRGWLKALHPQDRDRVTRGWHDAARTCTPYQTEYRFRRPDDSEAVLWSQTEPEYDGEGRLVGFLGTITDLTEQKRQSEKLRELEQDAERRARLADVGAITSRLAHDLGNPLAGLLMQAQLIQRAVQRGDSIDVVHEPTEHVISTVRHLHSIMTSFRNFAREQRLQAQPVDVSALLIEVVRQWRLLAEQSGVELTWRCDEDLEIQVDEAKMRRVLDNLVKNGVEALSEGGGHLTLSASRLGSDQVRISVEDDGPGVPEGVDIFALFETTKDEGTGIGLAVCRQFVHAHGGAIEYEAVEPHGTVFHIDLPVRHTLG